MSNKFNKPQPKPLFDKANDKTMTIEELKACEGFEHLSDEEAEEVLQSILWFCEIAARAFIMQMNSEDKQAKDLTKTENDNVVDFDPNSSKNQFKDVA